MNDPKTIDPKDNEMKKHYVKFFSPGTFMAEDNTEEVKSWDVKAATKRAGDIEQRYSAIPYGFYFYTMERAPGEWEPKRTATSPMYFLPHCKLETLEEIDARDLPDERILRSNMHGNGYKAVIVTTKGWKWTQPFDAAKDVLLHD